MDSRSSAVEHLLGILDKYHVGWAIVGDPGCFPSQIDSDVDVVVHQESLMQLAKAFNTWCQDLGWQLVQTIRYERTSTACIFMHKESETLQFLAIDVITDFVVNGRIIVEQNDLLLNRTRKPIRDRNIAWYDSSDKAKFIYYLSKRLLKKDISEAHVEFFRNLLMNAPDALVLLHNRWGRRNADRIIALLLGSLSNKECALQLTKQDWCFRDIGNTPSLLEFCEEIARRTGRICYPVGLSLLVNASEESCKFIGSRWCSAFPGGCFVAPFEARNALDCWKRKCRRQLCLYSLQEVDATSEEMHRMDDAIICELAARLSQKMPDWLFVVMRGCS